MPLLHNFMDTPDSAVYAVYPASRNISPKVRVFIDHPAACFGTNPYWDLDLS